MLQRKLTLWTVCLLSIFFFSTSAQAVVVDKVIITADNAYGFGWGDVNGIPMSGGIPVPNHWFGIEFNKLAKEIFNEPEEYGPIVATIDDYFYIISFADKATWQGVIAEVFAVSPDKDLITGAGEWEVYATGITHNHLGPWHKTNHPTVDQINSQIQKANSRLGDPLTTSKGWVNASGRLVRGDGFLYPPHFPATKHGILQIGEKNDSNAPVFPIVKDMQPDTKWIWYNPNPTTITNPFQYGIESDGKNDGSREFLIFRLPVRKLTKPCCDDCCDDKFKLSFSRGHTINLDPQTGRLDLRHPFSVDVKGPPTREIAKVNATLVSSWKTCNGQKQSLGMHYWQPPPPMQGILSPALSGVMGWNGAKLTSPPFSHELTWTRNDLFNTPSSFSLNNPLALTIPVSELQCAQTIGFCIKYTFIDSHCQVCEEVVKCYEYSLRPGDTRRSTLEEAKPTLAPPEVPRDDTPKTNPSTSGPSRTSPSRTSPSRTSPSRTNPSRTNPGRTNRPTIRRPVDLRPANLQRGAGRPLVTRPTDAKKDPRKPVVDRPADGKEAPQKSDREKPATKKPAERKEAEAKRGDDEPANRSVLLKK